MQGALMAVLQELLLAKPPPPHSNGNLLVEFARGHESTRVEESARSHFTQFFYVLY
jgi:hypothetical protein